MVESCETCRLCHVAESFHQAFKFFLGSICAVQYTSQVHRKVDIKGCWVDVLLKLSWLFLSDSFSPLPLKVNCYIERVSE